MRDEGIILETCRRYSLRIHGKLGKKVGFMATEGQSTSRSMLKLRLWLATACDEAPADAALGLPRGYRKLDGPNVNNDLRAAYVPSTYSTSLCTNDS